MASNLKNLLALDGNWLVEVVAKEPAHLEPYQFDDNNQLNDDNHEFKLPEVIGILPIRNAVAYPGTLTPLAVGRKRSKALLADTEPNESVIGLLTQRNPETDRPDFNNLYSIGTAVSVLKATKLPQGSVHILVHGITRFKVIEKVAVKPYLKARIQPLSTKVRTTKKLQALIVSVRQAANRFITLKHRSCWKISKILPPWLIF
jgi:ATP-dependent Lon protease